MAPGRGATSANGNVTLRTGAPGIIIGFTAGATIGRVTSGAGVALPGTTGAGVCSLKAGATEPNANVIKADAIKVVNGSLFIVLSSSGCIHQAERQAADYAERKTAASGQ